MKVGRARFDYLSRATSAQTFVHKVLSLLPILGCALLLAGAPALAQNFGGGGFGSTGADGGPSIPGMGGGTLGAGGLGSMQQSTHSLSGGTIGDSELSQLCQGAAAKRMSQNDVQALGQALGLNVEQMAQLNDCVAQVSATGVRAGRGATGAMPQMSDKVRRWLETSSIETRFRDLDTPYKLYTGPTTKDLVQFGYDVFNKTVSTFSQSDNAPVSDDYILGPQDEVVIYTWGRINQTLSLTVDRRGEVMIPDVGPTQVGGLTFSQAKKLIEGRMHQITGLEAEVTMGQLRSIEVFVIGKVAQPGLYDVSGLSHVSNALQAAGGISKVGSLRGIELRRDGKVISDIDLYDMLLHGDTSADVRLKPRDVIFVPVIGPVVAVTGDVKSPAIYEMKGSESLGNLLRMAGGVTAFGYSERLQVQRVQNHDKRIALDVNLNANPAGQFPVYDGDLVKVFTVLPTERNVVSIRGNVGQPGTYEWHPGMRVADLIRQAQGPSNHTFFDYALLRRREGTDRSMTPMPIDLGEALSNPLARANLLLRPEDTLQVYSQSELSQTPTVSIQGEVRSPGKYPLLPGMSVRELVYGAGGLMEHASRDRAQLTRTEIANGSVAKYTHMDVDLGKILNSSDGERLLLKPDDELLVQQASNWHTPWHVLLHGQVMRPGPYPIREGERLATVLEASGGFRPDAYPRAAVFIRTSVRELQQEQIDSARARLQDDIVHVALMPQQGTQEKTSIETLNAIRALLTSSEATQALGRVVIHIDSLSTLEHSSENIVLQNKDKLTIPVMPASVQVLGQVYNPNAIVYQPGLRVQDYLQKAGGATDGGDIDHIYVIKADGSVLTEEGARDAGKNRLFPLLPSISGGLMEQRLEPGDTVYVPEKLLIISSLQYAKDVSQIVANAALSLGVIGLLGSSL